MSNPLRAARILLVEDNPGDAMLVAEAMADNKIHNELIHLADGESALRYLQRQDEFANALRPDLILLDLNLPGLSGQEVLASVKEHDDLKTIPVVVMTSSEAEADIIRSYQLHANCFVTKPIDLDQFMHVVRSTENFFVTIAKLPPTP